jgi:hypothetical protein
MDKRVKLSILLTINNMKLNDLIDFVKLGDISLEEMIDNGLNPVLVSQIQEHFKKESERIVTEEDMINSCKQIENGEVNAIKVRDMLLSGAVTEALLLKHTSLSQQMIDRIRNYQKQPTPFAEWTDLPPLKSGYTDLYFLGQPGSGKSCILASIFYYLNQNGMIIDNVHNLKGTIYRNQLVDEFRYGILPDSTILDGVNYIPIELLNNSEKFKGRKHPLNFIEMSGELFDKTYNGGISIDSIAARNYLKNTNRKLLYFILDYHEYEESKTVAMGPSQSNKLQAVLALLDQYGTLEHTDGIHIVVTKSDLFPYGVNQKEYAANFVKDNFKGLITNCKNLQEKYRNKFDIIVYPFSIGDVRFQNMLVNISPESPKMVVEDMIKNSFMTTASKLKKYFS